MRVPSGDQAGVQSSSAADVSCRAASMPQTSLIQMCLVGSALWPGRSPSQQKATWFASGENDAYDSDPDMVVTGTRLGSGGLALSRHASQAATAATSAIATGPTLRTSPWRRGPADTETERPGSVS